MKTGAPPQFLKDSDSMAEKTITSFFERYEDAAEAVRRLETAGIPHRDISLVANNEDERYSSQATRTYDETSRFDDDDDGAATGATVGTLAGGGAGLLAGLGMLAIPGLGPVVAAGWLVSTLVGAGAGAALGGLAGSLVDAGVDENDAHAYAEGVRRGGALVTVRSSEADVDRIVDILDDEGTVDFDERQTSWRSEGWAGRDAGPIGAAASTTTGLTTGMTADMIPGRDTSDMGAGRDTSSMDTARNGSSASGREDEVIPVVEEELHVGKREVNRGRVRIHSHVVERPVHEQVELREERVEVERRPVSGSRLAGAGDDALFQERTIEMEERAEEPVVSKEARVKEELVVRKEVDQRAETVSDTVRSTEVEVEDERNRRSTGTTGKPTDLP
jgi:stress response protein YsnF